MRTEKEWTLLTVREHPTNKNEQIGVFKINDKISFDISAVENSLNREDFTKVCQIIAHAPQMLEMFKSILAQEHLKGTIEESKIKQLIQQATTIK